MRFTDSMAKRAITNKYAVLGLGVDAQDRQGSGFRANCPKALQIALFPPQNHKTGKQSRGEVLGLQHGVSARIVGPDPSQDLNN